MEKHHGLFTWDERQLSENFVPCCNMKPPIDPPFSSSDITALCHYYRAEMTRANTWRTRLDVTTNWAIVTTAAFLTVAFGNPRIPHFVLILATIFVLFFLIIESRRYKYFDLWRWRIALLNENFFATVIYPELTPLHPNWRELLGNELKASCFKITLIEAFGRRLRRNYSGIFMVLATCWVAKVAIHPEPLTSLYQIVERATVFGLIPGWLVLSLGLVFNGGLVFIALFTLKKKRIGAVQIRPVTRKEY